MKDSTAEFLPPTPEEIETARKELYELLEESEHCPKEKMRPADVVFKEARERLNAKF